MKRRDFFKNFISECPVKDTNPVSDMKYYFVELGNSERPALESIKISFDYLNKADFVR
jgi:hypothetical protein